MKLLGNQLKMGENSQPTTSCARSGHIKPCFWRTSGRKKPPPESEAA